MKSNSTIFFLYRLAFSLLFVLMVTTLFGQTPAAQPESPFHQGTTGAEVFNWYTGLYGALITGLTYLQGYLFPNAGSVPQTVLRWVLIAGVTAAIFVSLGLTSGMGVFLGFIGSAIAYDKVLKPLGMTTKSTNVQA